jgi:hypothetical protein
MLRDLDIPHRTVPVPAETESDSNTDTRDITKQSTAPKWHLRNTSAMAFAYCFTAKAVAPQVYRANFAIA